MTKIIHLDDGHRSVTQVMCAILKQRHGGSCNPQLVKKILCPTDFSDIANNGISYAAKLCQSISGTLTLFNVQSLMEQTVDVALGGRHPNEAMALAQLGDQCEQLHRAFHISCEASVEGAAGSALHLIGQAAADFDLVVMGTSGPHDLVQFLIGSHTYRVIRQTNTPLLLVPMGTGFSQIEKVALAYDSLTNQALPLQQAAAFVGATHSDLTVLQVNPHVYSRNDDLLQERLKKEARVLFPDLALNFETIYSDEIVNSLHRYMTNGKADVLTLCTEDHHFLHRLFHSSTIKAMSVIAEYPVLIVHT